MRKRARHQHSGFGLISVLLAAACVMVLAAAILPSSIRLFQVNNEVGAAQSLGAMAAANFTYASRYGSFVAPSALVGNLANTTAQPCANPLWLLQASQASASAGYKAPVFLGGTAATTPPCTGINGFQSYQIQVDPISPLEATRHFLYDSSTSQIYFTTEPREATTGDAVYQLASIGGGVGSGSAGTGGGTSGGGTTNNITVWNSTAVAVGNSVLRATNINGDTCSASGSSGGYTGVYVSLIAGNTSDPCQNTGAGANSWFCTCGIPTWSAAPPPGLNGTFQNVQAGPGGGCSGTGNDLSQAGYCNQLSVAIPGSISSVSYHNFSFSLSTPNTAGATLYIQIENLNNHSAISCFVSPNGSTSSCSGTGTLSISPGDQNAVFIGLQFPGGQGQPTSWASGSFAVN
jgi:hypothetical protein